jgi:hypothetical protein
MRLGTVLPETESVWADWLYSRTCLQFSRKSRADSPGKFVPGCGSAAAGTVCLAVQGGSVPVLILLMWLCVLTALGISALNNRDLIRQVSTDLQRWNAIPMNHYRPKQNHWPP